MAGTPLNIEDHQMEMEEVTGDVLVKLTQALYDQIHQKVREGGSPEKPSMMSPSQPPAIAGDINIFASNMDQECEILGLVQHFVVQTANAHMEKKISALQTRRNQLLPIHRLPDEVLSSIFVLAEGTRHNRTQPLHMRTPFVVSLVSKQWRAVALNTPTLWTTIDVITRPISEVFIDRSKSALLGIDLLWGPDCCAHDTVKHLPSERHRDTYSAHKRYITDVGRFLSPLIPHANRWRSLRVQGVRPGVLESLLSSPAPSLEILHVQATPFDADFDVSSLHGNLFAGHTPCLRDLSLASVYQPLTSAIYHGLKDLDLGWITYPNDSVGRLLHNLAMCPLLEHLTLSRIQFAPSEASDTTSLASFTLPCLQLAMFTHMDPGTLSAIFSSVRFPASILLKVTGEGDPSTIFPSSMDFPSHLPAVSLIRRLRISGNLTAPHAGVGEYSAPNHGLFNLEFRPSHQNDDTFPERVCRQILTHLPFQSISALTFQCLLDKYVSAATFASILEGLPTIASLALLSCSHTFLELLVCTTSSRLCPALSVLRISVSEITEASLIDLVISRRDTTDVTSLAHLLLSGCNGMEDEDALERILERFVEVHWEEQWDTVFDDKYARLIASPEP
ncbi:hypothetical protein BOTBODRAFT_36581 [Botryobasidium botryosum FD-172 SS1]|uniref:F-box domain-containing protein n=1 Tax=Botryobasidium botryosum (strain FD-172 SS1) TaxID=930990 RepID=A0A067MDK8_BOTB1|nr:hypothetical protein BOTBODRAFT_36581 [Botryobasidium botryosum FD-172 SS1]